MTDSVNLRELALEIVMEVMEESRSYSPSHIIIGQTLKKYQYLDKQQRSFLTRLSEGTIENLLHLDYIINQFSKVKVNKMKPLVRNLLRISVYQIKYMDSIPDSAVCNEAVKIAIKRGFVQLKGFVNGVLRTIARNIDDVKYPDPSYDMVKYLSIVYSMPEWIVEEYVYQFGIEDAAIVLKKLLLHDKGLCVRCNTAKASVDEIIEMLESDGVTVKKGILYDKAIYLYDYDYLTKYKAFNEGYIQVQDLSSMLVACAVNPKSNSFCIDMCAAPGGKTLHLADMLNNTGTIISRDVSEYKVSLIDENIERTGYTNIKTEVYDGCVLDESLVGKADIVIADVPCSGLGVIAKKSDIKYKMTKEGVEDLVKLQREILKNAVEYLKKDGVLIYSTCTITDKENIDNYKWLVNECGLYPDDMTPYVSSGMVKNTCEKGYMQIMPGEFDSDGFFVGRLIKR